MNKIHFGLALAALCLVACEPQQPTLTPSGGQPTGGQDSGVTETRNNPNPTPNNPNEPRLTGFFEPGNFAVVTVPDPSGEGERQMLSIKDLKVEVTLIGRMARTKVTQVFHNHTNRRTEGSYEFTLPSGAAISRLAMDVEGKMMEGELVEREKARQIYESIVRRQKDPALLEWQGGERFKTQIFPIEANADKTVVLSYDQLLPTQSGQSSYRYSLPNLEGQPAGSLIERFAFVLRAEDATGLKVSGYEAKVDQRQPGGTVSVDAARFKPVGPLSVAFQPPGGGKATVGYATRKNEPFFLVDFVPELPQAAAKQAQHLVVGLDTSAGIGQVELDRAIEAARSLIKAQPAEVKVNVVTGDWRAKVCREAPVSSSEALECLDGLKAGGATDLGALLGQVAKAAAAFEGAVSAVVFTDGTASLGELDGDLIKADFIKAKGDRDVSLHAVAIGHAPNESYLAELSRESRGHTLRMTPQDTPQVIASRIGALVREPLLTQVEVTAIEGKVEGLVPHKPVNLARGESLAVMGRLDGGPAKIQVKGIWRGQALARTFDLEPSAGGGNALLVNFWARSVIEEMQDKAIPRDKIVATSLEYGVMSRYTSFLVLENEEAYKRFKIERRKEKERRDAQQVAQGNLRKGDGNLQDLLADGKMKKAAEPDLAAEGEEAPEEDSDDDGDDEEKAEVADAKMDEAPGDAAPPPRAAAPAKDRAFRQQGQRAPRMEERAARRPAPRANNARADRVGSGGAKGTLGLGGMGRGKKSGASKFDFVPLDASPSDFFGTQIKDLEKDKKTLNEAERQRLLHLYVKMGQGQKARAWFQQCKAKLDKAKGPDAILELLNTNELRNFFATEHAAAAKARLGMPDPSESVIQTVWHDLQRNKPEAIAPTFAGVKMVPTTATNLLLGLVNAHPDKARGLVDRWVAGKVYTKGELYQVLTNDRRLALQMPAQLFAVTAALVAEGDSRPEVIEDYVTTGVAQKKAEQVAPAVFKRCDAPHANKDTCRAWYTKLASVPEVRSRLKLIHQARLAELQKRRAQDMGNLKLIREAAGLLEEIGETDAASRMLSEMVEFAPHDFGTRRQYAFALVNAGDIEGGCAQHSAAVQLNPAERDAFKTMMALRRSHEDKKDALRECIVRGVSKLPVHRAVSLVLTWEDPSADVDLHIHEVGGEEVFYSHRESKNNGLLYYDITDGFGPEIYVLGSGPAGEYRLTLVYYSGRPKNLKGKLTILRNAGAPDETREDREFVLPTANNDTQIPIGVFRL